MKNEHFLLLILLVFFVFWIWWIPGPRAANDFSFISSDWIKLQFDLPRVWSERGAEGLGEYSIFTLWSYPINLLFGILSNFGLNFEIWERLLILLFISVGSISIWKFLSSYSLSAKSKFIGSLFYLLNTYPLLLIDGGQISIALAYGLFPLAFLLIFKAAHLGLRNKIVAGLIATILGYFDIRFLFILFLLTLGRLLFDILENEKKRLKILWNWINLGIISGIVILILNAFWLFPYIKNPIEKDVLDSFTKLTTNFLNIGHPLLMIAPHWYKNIFGQISQLKPEFIIFPILVFLAPILRRNDKNVLFWLFVAVTSIFLAKGNSEPFPYVYPWLHSNIPGFSFFRDSTKFFFLIALAYSVLISITSEEILKRILGKKVKVVYLIFITVYFVYLIKPVLLGQMTGTFSIHPAEKEFQTLASILQEDNNFGRVFWIPGTAPLSYFDLNHPIAEAARVFNRIPFVYGVKGTYEIFNFLREAPYMGEIFDVAGISYIAYPNLDERRDNLHPDNQKYYSTFLNQLTSLPWIEKTVQQSKVPLLKIRDHQDKIFITDNTWIVFGSDEIFNEATKSSKLRLSKNAIIFAEQKNQWNKITSKYPEAKIVLNKKGPIDLIMNFVPETDIYFPANQLMINPDISGWWKNNGKDLITWRYFLQNKYNIDNKDFDLGGGWAVSEGNKELTIGNRNGSQWIKRDVLFARVLESKRGGNLNFYQENQLIGTINNKVDSNVVRWFEVGTMQKGEELIIKTEGDINIINALVLVNPEDLQIYKKKAKDLEKQVFDFKIENAENSSATIIYKKINQTKYKVTVTNLTAPKTIVFSATYHPKWKLDGEPSIPIYGFLNGFRVEKDGEYTIEFESQKDVEEGLFISFAAFGLLLLYLLSRKNKHN